MPDPVSPSSAVRPEPSRAAFHGLVGLRLGVEVPADSRSTGIVFDGEVDVASTARLQVAVAVACRAAEDRLGTDGEFRLDLGAVTFLDSCALYALEAIHAEVTGRGWTLVVTPPTAAGPLRLLALADTRGWLPRGFIPAGWVPAGPVVQVPAQRPPAGP